MARARVRREKSASDLAEVILAEWFRLLPPVEPADPDKQKEELERLKILKFFKDNVDIASLSAAFSAVLDVDCEALLDGDGSAASPLRIVVPLPPKLGQKQLYEYLDRNSDFKIGMGAAILFGCGR